MMGGAAAWATPIISLETDGQGQKGRGRENRGENSQQIHRIINHSRLGCAVVNEGGNGFAQCSNNELLLISTSFLKDRS